MSFPGGCVTFLRLVLSATELPSFGEGDKGSIQCPTANADGHHGSMLPGETLRPELPISTIRFPEKLSPRIMRNRFGGSGLTGGHPGSPLESCVMLITPKVLARDTVDE
jgi:hypothetical protein